MPRFKSDHHNNFSSRWSKPKVPRLSSVEGHVPVGKTEGQSAAAGKYGVALLYSATVDSITVEELIKTYGLSENFNNTRKKLSMAAKELGYKLSCKKGVITCYIDMET